MSEQAATQFVHGLTFSIKLMIFDLLKMDCFHDTLKLYMLKIYFSENEYFTHKLVANENLFVAVVTLSFFNE